MVPNEDKKNWRPTLLATTCVAAVLAFGLSERADSAPMAPGTSSHDSPTEAAPASDSTSDLDGASSSSAADGDVGVSTRVASINVVSDATERRMRREIEPTLAALADDFRACYRTHAVGHSEPERTIYLDWTVTTDGEPVDVTAFTSHTSLEPCFARVLRGQTFESADDRHPRIRAELTFE